MSTIRFPFERTLEFPRQQDRREFVFMAIEGHPPERQKKILLEARAIGLLSDQDTGVFMDAAGLRGA
jgi:hypothetical protein